MGFTARWSSTTLRNIVIISTGKARREEFSGDAITGVVQAVCLLKETVISATPHGHPQDTVDNTVEKNQGPTYETPGIRLCL